MYYYFYYYQWVDISVGELSVPDGITRPVVNVSVLAGFIRYKMYIYYWNLQFLNNVIINKDIVLLLQALADFEFPV